MQNPNAGQGLVDIDTRNNFINGGGIFQSMGDHGAGVNGGTMRQNHVQVFTNFSRFPTRVVLEELNFIDRPELNDVEFCIFMKIEDLSAQLLFPLSVPRAFPVVGLSTTTTPNSILRNTEHIFVGGREFIAERGLLLDIHINELVRDVGLIRSEPTRLGVGNWTARFRFYFQ